MANYLYNGVVLPDINEVWTDKETYPYACITIDTSNGYDLYILSCSAVDMFITSGGVVANNGSGKFILYVLIADEDAARENDAVANEWCLAGENEGNTLFGTPDSLIYSNRDILNTDGTVYLAASEPVPVDNNITIPDKASFMLGYLTGQRLRKMRVIEPVIEATQTEDELYSSTEYAV